MTCFLVCFPCFLVSHPFTFRGKKHLHALTKITRQHTYNEKTDGKGKKREEKTLAVKIVDILLYPITFSFS